MSTEVTVELGKAYLQDRVKELRNQLPLGDPFIFLGISTILNVLKNLAPDLKVEIRESPPEADPDGEVWMNSLVNSGLLGLSTNFSLGGNLELTHTDSDDHLTFSDNNKLILNAELTLHRLDELIEDVFSVQGPARSHLHWMLNKHKFVGLG